MGIVDTYYYDNPDFENCEKIKKRKRTVIINE
jgi:hypothetical protein